MGDPMDAAPRRKSSRRIHIPAGRSGFSSHRDGRWNSLSAGRISSRR